MYLVAISCRIPILPNNSAFFLENKSNCRIEVFGMVNKCSFRGLWVFCCYFHDVFAEKKRLPSLSLLLLSRSSQNLTQQKPIER
mmetsp:Transcript_31566/g.48072  ORF Transcript_31566/g.48072 Transcript_31566/m.48072 type:complete len:84 (+) Transcript_31566:91-342(+)